jgi:zinc and cadmium transporter
MPVLGYIIATGVAAGVLSVLCAALFALSARAQWVPKLISYATGALLGAVFLEILPHAIEQQRSGARLGLIMLGTILVFFVLEKAVLWRHAHHHGEDHPHSHGGAAHGDASGVLIIVGDTVHNFIDGVIIAAAFMADVQVGLLTALAIVAHEIPQEVGDFVVLLHSGYSKSAALLANLVSSLATVVGGVAAYYALSHVQSWIAPLLGAAAASLLYVAVADLIPGLHKRLKMKDALQQIVLLLAGVGSIWAIGLLAQHAQH